jgi:hypothetical protein
MAFSPLIYESEGLVNMMISLRFLVSREPDVLIEVVCWVAFYEPLWYIHPEARRYLIPIKGLERWTAGLYGIWTE